MDKLTWFKFTPANWMMGKILKCPDNTQARFMRLCCLYWNKECVLSEEDAEIEIDKEHLDILKAKKVISINDGFLMIDFLNEQLEGISETSEKRKKAVNKRWENQKKKNTSVLKNDTIVSKTDTIVIQNDTDKSKSKSKIREELEEIRVDDEKEKIPDINNISFSNELKSNSAQWIETVAMQHKITPEVIPKKLDEFVIFLRTKEKIHPTKKEFIDHFTNWIPKNLQNGATKQTNRNR